MSFSERNYLVTSLLIYYQLSSLPVSSSAGNKIELGWYNTAARSRCHIALNLCMVLFNSGLLLGSLLFPTPCPEFNASVWPLKLN